MDHEAEMIREQMAETRTHLTEKLEALEEKVTGVVENANETVQTVKESVREAGQTVKEAFDLRRQVERHPWAMLGGAVALGYLGGSLLDRDSALTSLAGAAFSRAAAPPAPAGTLSSSTGAAGQPNWLGQVETALGPVFDKLKGLAIGAAVGLVAEMVLPSVPDAYRDQVTEVMRDFTTALGGKPSPSLAQEGRSSHEVPPAARV
jgi:ElaB/YqjD/DUF883 family membrane-anchored ribosome-binding protein